MYLEPCKQGDGGNYLARFAVLAALAFREISSRRFFESALARAFPPREANAVTVSSFTLP